jgi:hypothetical protein
VSERERFEEWAKQNFEAWAFDAADDGTGYSSASLQVAWEAWQAALATRPAGVCVCEGILETDLVTEYHNGEEGFSHHIPALAHESFNSIQGHKVRVWVEKIP